MSDTTGALAGAVLVCAVEGTDLTEPERAFFKGTQAAGVTLFTRNVRPEDQGHVAALVRDLQACRPAGAPPLVIAIDQEGGRVARLKAPFPNPGPAQQLAGGRSDAESLASIRDIAADQSRRLKALGVNVNFAPVVDVLTEPSNAAIGDRAFATDAVGVVRRAGAWLEGMAAVGLLGCLKHFPGQGAATVDTHAAGAIVDVSRVLLDQRELLPYTRLLRHVPMVMISHCVYPTLDEREASRSQKVIEGLLRKELGFQGVVVSDDMNMGAMPQDERLWAQAIVDAVAAGADMILVCRHLDKCWKAHAALVAEAKRSPAFARRLEEAAGRMGALRRQLADPART